MMDYLLNKPFILFAKKKEEEIEEPEETEETEEKEERPSWVNEILAALKPKETTSQAPAEIPLPPAPKTEEEEQEEEPPRNPIKDFLNWLL